MITIDKSLNLVIPLIRGDETQLYVHSTPISRPVFEKYHLVLARTFGAFAQNGLDPRSGPSVAALLLNDIAKDTQRGPGLNWFEGPDGVGGEAGLTAEMIRLSNALVSTPERGWHPMPLKQAMDQGLIDEEEKSEVLNLLTYFTVASTVAPRVDRGRLVRGVAAIYELQTTSSNCTEYASSLKTSTEDESSGEKIKVSLPIA